MLLGVLLALAAGALVIFVLNTSTTTGGATETVVVAKKDLPTSVVLSATQSDATHMLISDAFITQTEAVSAAPPNAYVFKSQEDLNANLNDKVVSGTFYQDDVLRINDPRLTDLGSSASGSLTNINPAKLKPGYVLVPMKLNSSDAPGNSGSGGQSIYVPGDHIDVIASICNNPSVESNGCVLQTTFQNLEVYSTDNSVIWVVLSHEDALRLAYLTSTANNSLEIVIRKPGDDTAAGTTPVDLNDIIKQFHF